MLINIHCAKCIGIEAVPVTVEVKIDSGLGIHLVGLADAAVKESLLRTITALQSMGYRIPGRKIVINLAPADMHKKGSGYDVPIALGIIKASGQRELPFIEEYIIMGELGLDGSVRDVPGALPIAELARAGKMKGCILPYRSAIEAMEYQGIDIYGVDSLDDVLRILNREEGYESLLVRNRHNADYTLPHVCFAKFFGHRSKMLPRSVFSLRSTPLYAVTRKEKHPQGVLLFLVEQVSS